MKTTLRVTLGALVIGFLLHPATSGAALVVSDASLTGLALAYTNGGNASSGQPLNADPVGTETRTLAASSNTNGSSTASLELTTSIQTGGFSLASNGSSSASAAVFFAEASSYATLDVTFTVTTPMLSTIALSGQASNTPSTITGSGLSSQLREDGNYVVDLSINSFAGGTGPGTVNYLLTPGHTYIFSTAAQTASGASTNGNPANSQTGSLIGTGSLTVVPEPGSLALLALGFLGLLARRRRCGARTVLLLLFLGALPSLHAGAFTWSGNGTTNNWSDAGNWAGGAAPTNNNASGDQFTFGANMSTSNVIDAYTFLNASEISFTNPDAAFQISIRGGQRLRLTGAGLQNLSGIDQVLRAVGGAQNQATFGGAIQVENSATTAGATIFNQAGAFSQSLGGLTVFTGTSSAADAIITNAGGLTGLGHGGQTNFSGSSTAGTASITNEVSIGSPGSGGTTNFSNSATAGSATITNKGDTAGGSTSLYFRDDSTAGNATIVNEGSGIGGTFSSPGLVSFQNSASAGNAVITSGGGRVAAARGGRVFIEGSSTAGTATIEMEGASVSGGFGATLDVFGNATAGSSTLLIRGGTNGGTGGLARFGNNADGGTARAVVDAGGTLDISGLSGTGMHIGSIEGGRELCARNQAVHHGEFGHGH